MVAKYNMSKEKKTILIVEDDETILRLLSSSFSEEEFTITTAQDGETAYTMTERLVPDLVLLDLVLPKKNGFEYLRDVRSNKKLKDIPVIVLSNLSGEDNINRAKDLGAFDYFVKSSADFADLIEKVKKAL